MERLNDLCRYWEHLETLREPGLGASIRITYSMPAGARGRLQPGMIRGREELRKPRSQMVFRRGAQK